MLIKPFEFVPFVLLSTKYPKSAEVTYQGKTYPLITVTHIWKMGYIFPSIPNHLEWEDINGKN
jgi:hypothetical protein